MWYFDSVVLRGNVKHFAADATAEVTTEAQRNMFALHLTKMTFSPLCYFNHRNVVHLIVFVTPQMCQILDSSNYVSDFCTQHFLECDIYQNIYIANHKYG